MAAIANVFIAVVALCVSIRATNAARGSASAEKEALRVTREALNDERKREDLAQAKRIAAYEVRALSTRYPTSFCLVNTSGQPVYEVGVALTTYGHPITRQGGDLSPDQFVRVVVLPPGRWRVEFGTTVNGMSKISAVELAFRDHSGSHWIRTSEGALVKVDEDMIEHYGLPMPYTPTSPVPCAE